MNGTVESLSRETTWDYFSELGRDIGKREKQKAFWKYHIKKGEPAGTDEWLYGAKVRLEKNENDFQLSVLGKQITSGDLHASGNTQGDMTWNREGLQIKEPESLQKCTRLCVCFLQIYLD